MINMEDCISITFPFKVVLDGKWGFIDETGREICPCIFDFAYIIHYKAVVKLNKHWGVIGYNGDYILPCLFDNVNIDDEIMFATKLAMEYTFDLSGECIGVQTLPNAQ